jgi:hypothetical protein
VSEEEGPEQITLPPLRARRLARRAMVASLGQRAVEAGREQAIVEKGPLRNRRLEDGVQRPRVIPASEGLAMAPTKRKHMWGGAALGGGATRNNETKAIERGGSGCRLTTTYAARSGWSDCSSSCSAPSAGTVAGTWSRSPASSPPRIRGGSAVGSSSCAKTAIA